MIDSSLARRAVMQRRHLFTQAKRICAPAGMGLHFWACNAIHSSSEWWKPRQNFEDHQIGNNEYRYLETEDITIHSREEWPDKIHDLTDDEVCQVFPRTDKMFLSIDHLPVTTGLPRLHLYVASRQVFDDYIRLKDYKHINNGRYKVSPNTYKFDTFLVDYCDVQLEKIEKHWQLLEDFFMVDQSELFKKRWYTYQQENKRIIQKVKENERAIT